MRCWDVSESIKFCEVFFGVKYEEKVVNYISDFIFIFVIMIFGVVIIISIVIIIFKVYMFLKINLYG